MMIYEKNTQSGPTQLYNLTMVDKMCRGNQESILKMVHVFISQISQSVEELTVAHQKKDFGKIKKEIHKVKPTLTYYGTPKIEKELVQLEKLVAGTFTEEEIERNINALNTITTQTIAKMKTDFSISND
jgi:HPt (histidine-containing phosphotransfer) domain-containing protein